MGEATEQQLQDQLSTREYQLLKLAAHGMTDQAIANRLGISLATVGTYWGRIRGKLGPHNRTELVALYLRDRAKDTISRLKDENQRLLDQLQHEQRLIDRLELYHELLNAANDAMVSVESNGRIVFANRAALELFGYASHEMRGLELWQLIPADSREEHRRLRIDYMAHPEKRRMGDHFGVAALRKDGSVFTAAILLNPTETHRGTVVTCIIEELADD